MYLPVSPLHALSIRNTVLSLHLIVARRARYTGNSGYALLKGLSCIPPLTEQSSYKFHLTLRMARSGQMAAYRAAITDLTGCRRT
ncbi:hypothetical protein SeMB42_g01005 [Synchytrium endobioticum]|uniref:Uncharacterized protein n=1 Tax=Synchytrium endobioticum TaxID=286115 RepID=A0A507DPD3_9FUNG|nr:hypothetical protein SeMB42_g01005 [Synchytrium endobioticum]